jgi:hypothetical protein
LTLTDAKFVPCASTGAAASDGRRADPRPPRLLAVPPNVAVERPRAPKRLAGRGNGRDRAGRSRCSQVPAAHCKRRRGASRDGGAVPVRASAVAAAAARRARVATAPADPSK